MKKTASNTRFIVLGMIMGILFLTYLMSPPGSQPIQEFSFSDFIQRVEGGEVQSVILVDKDVQGQTKSGIKFHTYAPNQYEGLVNQLVGKGVRVDAKKTEMSMWMSLPITVVLLLLLIFIFTRMQGRVFTSFGKSRAKLNLNKNTKGVTFNNVAGIEEAKAELQETVDFLREPARFKKLGGKPPRGILLTGHPGTGKTLLAKAIAGEASVPFFSVSGSDFVEMFAGVGAARVRSMFKQAKKNAPCIIFIDEIDAVGRHRGTGIGQGNDEREQTLNQLLVEMDGFESDEGVVIIAASNRPDILDPALLRPGRFDRRVVVDMPDIKGRDAILKVHAQKIPLANDANLTEIARGTPGFSGADLASLINEAALNAARNNAQVVSQQDLEFAKDKVMMGAERKTLVISENEKRATAIHEAGHAVVALFVPKADPLHKVTIIPRGMALGLTQQLPLEDRHNYSREYLESQLVILMGGRCAEEEILGQQTTGASNDIERATGIARQMVCEWGMSKLGPLNFVTRKKSPFLGKQLTERSHQYSEKTSCEIDSEVKAIVEKALATAKNIIIQKQPAVEKLAAALIERETLEGEEIKKIVNI